MAIDIRALPWMRRLAVDYAYDFPSLRPFFAGDPASSQAWRDAITRTGSRTRRLSELASIVQAQQRHRRAPARAIDRAARLADRGTVAIVTGQQAGLFGGPLFTLLKAITALKLAERAAEEHRVEAIAVFWIDAEDHDWDEIRSCTILDDTLTPQTIALAARAADRAVPSSAAALEPGIEQAVQALRAALPTTEFSDPLVTSLGEAYRPGLGMAAAFGAWLERTLGDRGLVVYDASDPAAKPLVSEVFAHELSTPGETARLAARTGAALASRGYHAQVTLADDTVALFQLNGERRPVRQENGAFVIGDQRAAAPVLVARAAAEPHLFSPNVLLRPIVQDVLFPTVCYVAGPNELAYLAQLKDVYTRFEVPMPLIHPRATATIADAAALRFLTKYDVPFESLQPRDEAGLNQLLAAQIPPRVEAAFAATADAVDREMTSLVGAIAALDPTLTGAAQSTLGRMQRDLQTLHAKMIQAAKRRDETLRRQYARTQALFFPNGRSQEREIGYVSFLNQYGPVLIDRLYDDVPLDLGRHWIVAI